MDLFDEMVKRGHEQVIFSYDRLTGMKCIIALHDTTLGPAVGGCRMRKYDSTDDALLDVLRLSRGMTYKCAAAGVDFGGGKAVLLGDETDKSEYFFRAFGRVLKSLGGRFATGTDLGTEPEDFVHVARESGHLLGLPVEYGGSGSTAVSTAYGVYQGFRAVAQELRGSDSLQGLTVALQGLGKVGSLLLQYLADEGAVILAADVDEDKVASAARAYSLRAMSPAEILGAECDILSPNALGGVFHDGSIPRLNCRAIAGSANNVLEEPRHGDALEARGILYAPDYVVNAGGMIQAVSELNGGNPERVRRDCERIYEALREIFRIRREEGLPTYRAADRMAEDRLSKIAALHRAAV